MRHIVIECECIHQKLREGNFGFPEALGFKGSPEGVNSEAVEVTKIECWWKKSREGNIAWDSYYLSSS